MRGFSKGLFLLSMIALGACRNHETITGSYGDGVVTGRALVVAGAPASPAGVRASVVGTGMSALLGEDGGFTFTGVPDNARIRFTREDGIDQTEAVTAQTLNVQLQPLGDKGGRRRSAPSNPLLQFEGLIKAVSAASITITASHDGDVTLVITADTVIRKGDTRVLASDLKVGDRVHATAAVKDNVKTAVEIKLQNPEGEEKPDEPKEAETMTANGTVTAASATQLTVRTVPRGDVTVQIDAKTIIRKQGTIITGADIHVGDEVNSVGTRVDDHTLKAIQIEVRGNSKDDGHGHH